MRKTFNFEVQTPSLAVFSTVKALEARSCSHEGWIWMIVSLLLPFPRIENASLIVFFPIPVCEVSGVTWICATQTGDDGWFSVFLEMDCDWGSHARNHSVGLWVRFLLNHQKTMPLSSRHQPHFQVRHPQPTTFQTATNVVQRCGHKTTIGVKVVSSRCLKRSQANVFFHVLLHCSLILICILLALLFHTVMPGWKIQENVLMNESRGRVKIAMSSITTFSSPSCSQFDECSNWIKSNLAHPMDQSCTGICNSVCFKLSVMWGKILHTCHCHCFWQACLMQHRIGGVKRCRLANAKFCLIMLDAM